MGGGPADLKSPPVPARPLRASSKQSWEPPPPPHPGTDSQSLLKITSQELQGTERELSGDPFIRSSNTGAFALSAFSQVLGQKYRPDRVTGQVNCQPHYEQEGSGLSSSGMRSLSSPFLSLCWRLDKNRTGCRGYVRKEILSSPGYPGGWDDTAIYPLAGHCGQDGDHSS